MDDSRRAILAGVVVTAVATAGLWVLPAVITVETINGISWHLARDLGLSGSYFFEREHPLRNLRFFGGFLGGIAAGYLSRDELNVGRPAWGESVKNGIVAGLGGTAGLYVLYVLFQVAGASIVEGVFPPPIYLIAMTPFLILLPFFPAFLVEGIVGALLGHAVHRWR